jgi:hypothetical protein
MPQVVGLLLKPWVLLILLLVLFIVQYMLYYAISKPDPVLYKSRVTAADNSSAQVSTTAGPHDVSILGKVSSPNRARIAVLLPYLGKSLPAWFDLFAFTAQTSAELVDWYIFITEAPIRAVPSNVHLIRLSRLDIFRRLATLDERFGSSEERRQTLQSYFEYLIDQHPYVLVEIKPTLGYLFSDYAKGYTHWAYADLDLLVGRMHLQLLPAQLSKHDIITLSFGDNNRLYMRGQFTIHKNNENVTNLWRGCTYLTDIGSRMEQFFIEKKRWDFHSAEGCYSRVVADNALLSVLYVPLQFSDAFPGSLDQKETLLLGGALTRCYGGSVTDDIIKQKYTEAYTPANAPGSVAPLKRFTKSPLHCSYWVDPADQVVTNISPVVIFLPPFTPFCYAGLHRVCST